MKVSLHPKPVRRVPAAAIEDRARATVTYSDKARDLLDRAGGDPIVAISLLMLAADQRKQDAEKATDPTLSEQALAQTVREQRDTIDTLKTQVELYRGQWQTAVDSANSLNADLAQREVDAEQITGLQHVLHTVTDSAHGCAHMTSCDLQILPVSTVVRDEAGRAWTRIDDEDGGVWATPTRDDTLSSTGLAEETAVWLAWVTVL